MRRGKVLVVEDDKDILNLIAWHLKAVDYEVLKAEDGISGINMALRERPDLIVLDLMLPGMNGLDVCKQLKKQKDAATIPIIILTARGEEADRILGLQLGANDYVVKPFSPRELVLRVQALMQSHSEKNHLEQQFFQAQKMESVGRLAGGIAHDYNNSLTIILGFADMALKEVASDSPVARHLHEIIRAAERSAAITRQLLTFARKQTIDPVVIDLNETVESTLKMLRRLIGEDVELVWKPGPHLWKVKMDRAQVDQILANLCVNAKDAIAGTGTITLETQNVVLSHEYCAVHTEFAPGEYVMLAVTDTGCGMDEETLSHIFEPFFTTKEAGKGTGLGLSTVYGIVRQNRGFVNVYSEPGVGTIFRIYIPREPEAEMEAEEASSTGEDVPRGRGETILLVEDDSVLLEMIRLMLTELGYIVLDAVRPRDGLALVRNHEGPVHVLMTDVVMPEMNGKQLSAMVRKMRPEVKVLYMSGYTADMISHQGVLDPGTAFIQKPFIFRDLALMLRRVLDANLA